MFGMTAGFTFLFLFVLVSAVSWTIQQISEHIRDVKVAKHTGKTPWTEDEIDGGKVNLL